MSCILERWFRQVHLRKFLRHWFIKQRFLQMLCKLKFSIVLFFTSFLYDEPAFRHQIFEKFNILINIFRTGLHEIVFYFTDVQGDGHRCPVVYVCRCYVQRSEISHRWTPGHGVHQRLAPISKSSEPSGYLSYWLAAKIMIHLYYSFNIP